MDTNELKRLQTSFADKLIIKDKKKRCQKSLKEDQNQKNPETWDKLALLCFLFKCLLTFVSELIALMSAKLTINQSSIVWVRLGVRIHFVYARAAKWPSSCHGTRHEACIDSSLAIVFLQTRLEEMWRSRCFFNGL